MALPDGSVVCDLHGAQNPKHRDRGIARYTVEHLRAVHELAPAALRAVALNPALGLPGSLDFLVGTGLLQWADPRRGLPGGPPPLWHVMSPFEFERTIDELWPAWARTRDTRLVVTLYDLIPLLFDHHYLADPHARVRYLARADLVRAAHHVLAISETTAADAVDRLGIDPGRITVIDAGVAATFAEAHPTDPSARVALDARLGAVGADFLLYVGGIEWRKNIERLIAGYAQMAPVVRARHQLVVACRIIDADRRRLERLAAEHGLAEGELVLTGYVTDAELAALYRLCRLFVFPSVYEGSGLPILEAMSLGAPVSASRGSTSPEILGDDEAGFDPLDVDDIGRVLEATVTDDALLARLRERSARRVGRYTWRHVGERTVAAYEATLGAAPGSRSSRSRPDGGRRVRRSRIAWVSPWPPERSGVATYSRRLVEAMVEQEGAEVDVLVGEPLDTYEPPGPGIRILPAATLKWAAAMRDYTQVVYSMGNSSAHRYVLELLRERPGVVLLHDVRLVGFYAWLAQQEKPDEPWPHLAHRIRAMYGDRLDARQFLDGPPTPAEQEAQGLFMTHEIQRNAEQILVHSRYAADLVRLDRPADLDPGPPVTVVPFAFPPPLPELNPPVKRRDDLIVSFGVVSEVKGLAVLIEAFALAHRERPDLRLILAGPGPDHELERWRTFADQCGVGGAVDLPGWISPERYEELLRTATLAVQLRTTSNGEASATVADALSAGLTTIVTAHGWAAELSGIHVLAIRALSPPVVARAILRSAAGLAPQRAGYTDGKTVPDHAGFPATAAFLRDSWSPYL